MCQGMWQERPLNWPWSHGILWHTFLLFTFLVMKALQPHDTVLYFGRYHNHCATVASFSIKWKCSETFLVNIMYTLHTSTTPHTPIWNSVVIIIWYIGVPFNPDAISQCCPLFVRTSRLVHVWHAWFPSSFCSNVCRSGLTAHDSQQANKSQELQPR